MVAYAQLANLKIRAIEGMPRLSVAVVQLFYHPHDAVWRDRVTARLVGLVEVDPRPIVEDAYGPGLQRTADGVAEVAILLLSPESLSAGLPRAVDHGSFDATLLLPVVVETLDRPPSLPAGVAPPRSLGGRPLADGSQEEIDAFLGGLRAELAKMLVPSWQENDHDAGTAHHDLWFTDLFQEHYPHLVVFFGRRGGDPELARDLAQETMIRVYRGLADYEWRGPLRTWILTIATNVWRNWLRDRHGTLKRGVVERSLDELRDAGELAAEAGVWTTSIDDPEAKLTVTLDRRRLRERLGDLSQLQRRCLVLWLEGWKYREIADEVGVSLQTVRATLHKAKARLRRLLAPGSVSPANEEEP